MDQSMSLWNLKEKESASIEGLDKNLSETYITRLRELGLDRGGRVTCLKKLPFGGPKVFQVSDSVFSLEEEIAQKILIKKV